MRVPVDVQTLIDQEIAAVRSDPNHQLLPLRRLMLYDAFGPTYASASYTERIAMLQRGQLPLTRADRVRARLALQTARHVLPLWDTALAEAGLRAPGRVEEDVRYVLGEMVRLYVAPEARPELVALLASAPVDYAQLRARIAALGVPQLDTVKQAVMQECVMAGLAAAATPPGAAPRLSLDPGLAEQRSVFLVPVTELPIHILQLAEGLLQGVVSPASALVQSDDLHTAFGNFLGYDEEELPAQAYDVGMAAYEALKQALGLGPFDGEQIAAATTDERLMGEGAAAAPAVKAYSGIFEDNISTSEFDPDKRLEFWMWWLTEAIPSAWATESAAERAAVETMPFRNTVRVTKYHTGVKVVFDEFLPDQ